jgi:biotin synthase
MDIQKLHELPLSELISMADAIRKEEAGRELDLCTIMNAKSGMCSEDCKFCAQSCHHSTGAEVYPLKTKDEMVEAAKRAKEIGSKRFGIVTSGNALTKDDLHVICDAIVEIRKTVGIGACASLGELSVEDLKLLKSSGLERYHHNIETSPSFYSKIVSTHLFSDRIKTVKAAMEAGLEVCSGGIIGLGESWEDRIEMALELKNLGVTSVPINILIPVKGTKIYGAVEPISCIDAIKTIAIFRIILRGGIVKLAAGRETVLKDFQAMAFMAGANGMLIGGYLTVKGRDVKDDRQLIGEIERAWRA